MQNPFAKGPPNAENLRSRRSIAKSTCDQRRSSSLKKNPPSAKASRSLWIPLDNCNKCTSTHAGRIMLKQKV
jgi:hypothetical protein